ncbi:MAG: ATP-binding cassette domain-containing protein [Lachnospiraceae bacterium]|nr:ATP-binding cassette domain-containing protein [Lachnospiraceae bacterium]
MMIDKRLIGTVSGSMRYIIGNVVFQWVSLLANIAMMTGITRLLATLFADGTDVAIAQAGQVTAAVILAAVAVRFACTLGASRMSFLSSKAVKRTLRERIYEKLLRLGASYNEQVQTSEVVQVAVEGVDQLETYFGAYLPQFFYAMLAPLTLFVYLCTVNVPSAIVLLVCVPLIPVAIAAVQTWAKKLLCKYWGQYTALGDTFLENLQGLTTLKIYQADEFKQQEMNEEAEKFRRITMKVLTMQLNSITIMDFIAYGGAALGIIMAATQYRAGHVSLAGCLLIILLGADFFLPMRQLGSYFHIAMNGMAASDKIFHLLDLPEKESKAAECPAEGSIVLRGLRFSYGAESSAHAAEDVTGEAPTHATKNENSGLPSHTTKDANGAKSIQMHSTKSHMDGAKDVSHAAVTQDREVLHGIDMEFPRGSFVSIVGESGCGKSTIASILMGRNRNYQGRVTIGTESSPSLAKGISHAKRGMPTPHNRRLGAEPGEGISHAKNKPGESGVELRDINEESLMKTITYVSHQSYLFKGTVRDNLLMGNPEASDEELWEALEQVKLADFLRGGSQSPSARAVSEKKASVKNNSAKNGNVPSLREGQVCGNAPSLHEGQTRENSGLDFRLTEQAGNLSGGQRQRLALARALLHDSPVYIFDEATSNIDVESENDIMAQIHALAKRKTVILISHRLANVTDSDCIYVMDAGVVVESGTHEALLAQNGSYAALWKAQQSLENYGNASSEGRGFSPARKERFSNESTMCEGQTCRKEGDNV